MGCEKGKKVTETILETDTQTISCKGICRQTEDQDHVLSMYKFMIIIVGIIVPAYELAH